MINIFKSIYFKLIHPNKVAKIQGVNFGINCNFGTKNFGSEPHFIKIGNDFYSSANVQFVTHDGSVNVLRNLYPEYKNSDLFKPIIIGNNVFIGFGAIILPGTIIEDNVIIGAGSVVKGTIKRNCVYGGIPAKNICSIEKFLEKNKDSFIDTKHMPINEKNIYITNWLANNFEDFKK